MKVALRPMVLGVLLVLAAVPALAQTADDIVDKYLAAAGGRAAFAKLTSRVATGSITLSSPVGDLNGTIEVYSKAPNKGRTLIKVDVTALGAGTVINDQRFDGTTGFVIDSLNGNREITGAQLDTLRNGAFPTVLLDYKQRGIALALEPSKQEVAGKPAYVITVTPKAGPPARMFVDQDSFMLVRTSTTLNVPQLGSDIEQVVEFSDFRDVDGIKVPFVTRTVNQVQTVVTMLTSVKHNVEIDDSMFTKPATQ
jgi:outer membrane lipoprotein-sorting protein